MTNQSASFCPQCGEPIPADAPAGLCPGCVLLGVATPTSDLPPTLAGAPTVEEVAAAFPELEVEALIGHGGMGVVFKARQPRLDRAVALKILPPSLAGLPGFPERFTREARALAKLSHPHIVAVYDFGERAGFYYLMMEFVEGVNLRDAMRAGVTPEQALDLVPRICEALQFAHDRGVLHRDIKPENILIDTRGAVKLVDFGIAKLAGDALGATGLTASGDRLGTAAYMAPEQIEQPATVDHRADIYSLGVVFYEMLTGELPLGRFAPPSERARVTSNVDAVVLRALEKQRERRQQSATEMKTQVEHIGATPPPIPRRRMPFWRILFWVAITLTPFALIPVFYVMFGRSSGVVLWPLLLICALPLVAVALVAFGRLVQLILSKVGAPRWAAITAGILAAILCIPVGCAGLFITARVETRSVPTVSLPIHSIVDGTQPPFIGHLPTGSIEVAHIAPHPRGDSRAWLINGQPANETPIALEGAKSHPQSGQFAREVVFRTYGLPEDASLPMWKIHGATTWAAGRAGLERGDSPLFGFAASFPETLQTTTIHAGIGMGAWTSIGHLTTSGAQSSSFLHGSRYWDIATTGPLSRSDGSIVIVVNAPQLDEWEHRVAAVLINGETRPGYQSTVNGQTEWRFPDTTMDAVSNFAFQVRPRAWVEFRNVQLHPQK